MYIPIPPEKPSVPTNDDHECAAAEGVPPEAEVTDADPNEIRVLHDPDNPIIKKVPYFLTLPHSGKLFGTMQ